MSNDHLVSTTNEMVNAFDIDKIDALPSSVQRIVKKRRALLGPAYRLQYERPAHFVRGEGVHLYDDTGADYLDAYNNVPSVGHCHPRVVEATARAMARLNTNTRYLDPHLLDYAEQLLETHDEQLNNVMFTCTGSEANDLAIRIARYHTGGEGVIITRHAYHGTTATIAAMSPTLGAHVPLGRHVRTVRPPFNLDGPQAGEQLADDVRYAIADLERHGIKFCAFLVDTLFTSDGILSDPAGFLAPAAKVAQDAGGLLIADEVQPGFGRTGEAMWGYQRHGVTPDIAVMGKPMGNGMPIAGLVARAEVLERFGRDARYFNTFGGNTVSIAAAQATLSVVQDEQLIQNAFSVGGDLRGKIEVATADRPYVGDIRGVGLYLGVDLVVPGEVVDGQLATYVVNAMRDRHVLVSATGVHGQTLKIRPPLVFNTADVDRFMDAFSQTLDDLDRELGLN